MPHAVAAPPSFQRPSRHHAFFNFVMAYHLDISSIRHHMPNQISFSRVLFPAGCIETCARASSCGTLLRQHQAAILNKGPQSEEDKSTNSVVVVAEGPLQYEHFRIHDQCSCQMDLCFLAKRQPVVPIFLGD
eukprot:gnl/TRDRNA2_/TRDRNA2_171650_c3_seq1.p1 gnl/TRDRNA2_/TRDRNA2_171650_c3~~gnl/TRDRNA2_/TRDRNA2_171650_c3_seq1.p1  ORF type:complete len:132 (-),score=17.06 gnl/TRDRNA2_/TRDRNA2_171650_c3_seq1:103-498(-)